MLQLCGYNLSTMDLRGISWAGNMYKTFESMCLEVEEAMYQDTVNYAENQMKTVGASVKKFYADVIEDLLPLSYEDLGKPEIRNLSRLHHTYAADIGILKKSEADAEQKAAKSKSGEKVSNSDIAVCLDRSFSDDSSITAIGNSEKQYELSSIDLVERQQSGWDWNETDGTESKLDMNETSRDMCSASEALKQNAYMATDLDDKRNSEDKCLHSESPGLSYSCAEGFSQGSTYTERPNENAGRLEEGRIYKESTDATECIDGLKTLRISPMIVDDCCDKGITMVVPSISDSPTTSDVSPKVKDLTHISETVHNDENIDGGLFYPAHAEISHISTGEEIEGDDPNEQRLQIDEQVGKAKLEESCVLVEETENIPISSLEAKKKSSYKKKIKDILSGRRWSQNKHEPEQLPRWYEDGSAMSVFQSSRRPVVVGTNTLQSFESCESDWELL